MNTNEDVRENADDVRDLEAHPELVRPEDTNDFFTVCPGGFRRKPRTSEVESFQSYLSTTVRQHILQEERKPEGFESLDEYKQSRFRSYSPIRLEGTQQKFFDDIDRVIVESGVSLEEIEQLNEKIDSLAKRCNSAPREEKSVLRGERSTLVRQLREKVMPAYHILRKMGYKHLELHTVGV